jgi:hypothetical protein
MNIYALEKGIFWWEDVRRILVKKNGPKVRYENDFLNLDNLRIKNESYEGAYLIASQLKTLKRVTHY